ncbi:YdcF family protein [Moorena bouillonii]|uniref:YdcF family protein n=1 Tax=Moorena bouillonii TaxID=207920 RepID=UPI0009D6EA10|nr:YdcF family protein [Moorena bouillonii]
MINLSRAVKWRRRLRLWGLLTLALFLCGWLLINTLRLQAAASAPVDTFFVLGGSIRREIHVAELVKQHPDKRILISHGSPDPCIWLIFQREMASSEQVWLEKCANSTFGNFFFSIPIFRRWGVRRVKLITSGTHLPRAQWMGKILLGAHGIWVDTELVQQKGIPGNLESPLKTGLDIARSLVWALLSQVIQPRCSDLIQLTDVDMKAWRESGFKCERQGGISSGATRGEFIAEVRSQKSEVRSQTLALT